VGIPPAPSPLTIMSRSCVRLVDPHSPPDSPAKVKTSEGVHLAFAEWTLGLDATLYGRLITSLV